MRRRHRSHPKRLSRPDENDDMDRILLTYTARFSAVIAVLAITTLTFAADSSPVAEENVTEDSVSPLNENGHLVDFRRDIAPILVHRCLDCHGPDDAKNDFRVDGHRLIISGECDQCVKSKRKRVRRKVDLI